MEELRAIQEAGAGNQVEEPLVRAGLDFALAARFQFQQQLGDAGSHGSREDDVGGGAGPAGQGAGDEAVRGDQRVAGADDVPGEAEFGIHVRKGQPLSGGRCS